MEYGDFLGKGWSFPLDFSNDNCVKISEKEQNIQESLYLLLRTYPGERLMHPDFGCRLRDYCFQIFDSSVATQIKGCVQSAVLLFEPRVDIESIDVEKDDSSDISCIRITLNYIVRSTNTRYNLVYPFYINEGTDVNI